MPAFESATLLFTDLVDAAKLFLGLAPQDEEELRRTYFTSLRKAVAETGGSEVKNLGDGLMVAFTSASKALSCAVAMQQSIERQNRQSSHQLLLRIGVSTGEVTAEENDYFGDPVIEAARLCAKAQGGQILASQVVQALAGRRNPFVFSTIGEIELKGLPEPVETVEVEWERLPDLADVSAEEPVPVPRPLTLQPSTGLIGRQQDLDILRDALKRVTTDEAREVVLIAGEAGQGKTTVAAAAAREAHEQGAMVLLGRCDEELGSPYRPFVEMLHHYISHAPEEVLRRHVAEHGPALSRLTRALGSRIGDLGSLSESDAETERYRLYGAILGILEQASLDQPVVLVLDDIQWADAASLQLLIHLVKSSNSLKLLVICTYRDTELSLSHPLTETLGALRREEGVHRIKLEGLGDKEVVQYLEAAAGQNLHGAGVRLAHAVYGETDGNPFFVSEMWRHLTESGAIERDQAGHWLTSDLPDASLPNSVREVVSARVARLGPEAGRILRVAAVIGRDFDLEHLSLATQSDEDFVLDVLDAASSVALVREVPETTGRFSFSHALVQHTLYDDMGATRRARAHRQVAETLEDLCAGQPGQRVGELAHHWYNATQQIDTQKAVAYSRQAAEDALAALAPLDAIRYFEQAIQLLDQMPEDTGRLAMDLRLGLGVAQRQAGVPAFRETLLEVADIAQQAGDNQRLIQAALENNRGFFSSLGLVDEERVAVLESALKVVPPQEPAARAVLLATLCTELAYGSLERRLELAREARDISKRLGDAATQIKVFNYQQLPLNIPEALNIRVHSTAKSVILARELGDPAQLFWSLCADRSNATQTGQVERSMRHLSQAKALAQRLRQPMMLWVAAYHEAADALVLGEPERAEELAKQALEIGLESGQPDALSFYGAQITIARIQRGTLDELAPLIVDSAKQNPGIAAYQACVAAAYLDAQDFQEARQVLDLGAANGFDDLPRDTAWLDAIAIYARVAIELGAEGPAESLIDQLAPYPSQAAFQCLTAHEPSGCLLGGLLTVTGRPQEAALHFEASMRTCARSGMKYAEAQTMLGLGRLIVEHSVNGSIVSQGNPKADAETLLGQSLELSKARGYGGIQRRALLALEKLNAI